MESSVDTALGRVALVLRLIGAVWMAVLVTVYGAVGGLDAPAVTWAVAGIAAGWAALAWRRGWIDAGTGSPSAVLAADLLVTSIVILVPGLFGERAGVSGGYPFAALLVGLATAGRRGVVTAGVVLCLVTLASLGAVGSGSLPFVVGNLLLYVLGAVALYVGLDVIRGNERRVRAAESALAVAEERAATASHLHDSVLQTLALVQRRAEDPGAVRSLARRQERELREWLFPTASPPVGVGAVQPASGPDVGPGAPRPGLLGPALEACAEEVEERHGVAVRVVTVGGAAGLPLPDDDRTGLGALAPAAREAMANAAVHAGVDAIDLFAEVDGDQVAVYVRDRGCGFDPEAIPADRHGVRASIVGRMQRAGGQAEIRSTPGRGTEVRLHVPHSRDRARADAGVQGVDRGPDGERTGGTRWSSG